MWRPVQNDDVMMTSLQIASSGSLKYGSSSPGAPFLETLPP